MMKFGLILIYFGICVNLTLTKSVSCPRECVNGYCCEKSDGSFGCCEYESVRSVNLNSVESNNSLSRVVCPDRMSSCQNGFTCCAQSDETWGCCQFNNAVCCSDGEHCCPMGTVCNVTRGSCDPTSASFLDSILTPHGLPVLHASSSSVQAEGLSTHTTPCGNGAEGRECPRDGTCCRNGTDQWQCCPMPNAVCCSDGEHCCPAGYQCDLEEGRCVTGLDPLRPTLATPPPSHSCPDNQSTCPANATCCQLPSENWACCPMPDAVCCSDGLHCCPSGYQCDIQKSQCRKTTSTEAEAPLRCPASDVQCPKGSTCCADTFGMWSCCPHPEAVCCSNGLHCCPKGSQCHPFTGECVSGPTTSEPPFKLLSYAPSIERCAKDAGVGCPNNTTCCADGKDGWRCCPMPDAVCCADHQHCCPAGTECSKEAQGCVPKQPVPSKERPAALNGTVCPGNHSVCPDDTTCCKLLGDYWGCCPLPNAVCCVNRRHCCPNGTFCSTRSGECVEYYKPPTPEFPASPMTPVPGWRGLEVLLDSERASWCEACPGPDHSCCHYAQGQPSMCCPHAAGACCPGAKFCCPRGSRCSGVSSCQLISQGISLPPYLIPAWTGANVESRLLKPETPFGRLLVRGLDGRGRIAQAKADMFMLNKEYRRLKSATRTICRNRMWYCPRSMQCCPLPFSRYMCLSKEESC